MITSSQLSFIYIYIIYFLTDYIISYIYIVLYVFMTFWAKNPVKQPFEPGLGPEIRDLGSQAQ